MTDEERREVDAESAFWDGYAAACDEKRAELAVAKLDAEVADDEVETWKGRAEKWQDKFEAERARSAKLAKLYHEAIPALEATGNSQSLVADMQAAFADWEVSRDRAF